MLLGSVVALLSILLFRTNLLLIASTMITWPVLLLVGYWRLLTLSTHHPQRMPLSVALLAAGAVVIFAVLGIIVALN
jgi:hypothetical protein